MAGKLYDQPSRVTTTFTRKRPFKRGDLLHADDPVSEPMYEVRSSKKVPCTKCSGTGVVAWKIKLRNVKTGNLFYTSLTALTTATYYVGRLLKVAKEG